MWIEKILGRVCIFANVFTLHHSVIDVSGGKFAGRTIQAPDFYKS